jgi:tetrahydromethanopterin S-methyltransferase subunit A
VFLEGFRKFVAGKKAIPKIVVVKSAEEVLEATKNIKPILAFTGPCSTENLNLEIPYVNVLKNPEKIADIVEKVVP